MPAASDPDRDRLTFSIAGQPPWTTFDTSTGLLEGVPATSQVGLFADIRISVSDGSAVASLAPFSVRVEAAPAPPGLDSRPSNTSCLAVLPPRTSAVVTLERAFTSLTIPGLTALAQPPDDPGSWYFTTRDGLIGRFDNRADVASTDVLLDLRGIVTLPSDGGLVQLVFHPDYPTDRRLFVNYSTVASDGVSTADVVISSFRLSTDGLSIDPLSENVLLRVPRGAFHSGGFMSFDHGGRLLVGLGDGAEQGDPTGRAQDMSEMLGKILRIDVDTGTPYGIPPDNPHAGSGGFPLEEIFAAGVRNPYRGDVDPESGRIYVADVGRSQREEVSEVLGGDNLGWNVKEGTRCHSTQYGSCSDATLVDPLVEYSHDGGNCSIIGGYFYHGDAIPELDGRFLFADFCTRKISAVEFDNSGLGYELPLFPGGTGVGSIVGFAQDVDGELYALTLSKIYKILPNDPSSGAPGPASQLSQTGCFDAADATIAAEGLIPYDLRAPLWSDGATKRRWIALPDSATIDLAPDGDFLFPDGTVLAKEFSIDGQPVETRLFMKDADGVWSGYSYEWIGGDAFLLSAAKQKVLPNGQTWHFPGRGECVRCHTDAANFALGPEIAQLNRSLTYPQTQRTANQLATLEHIGVLTNGLPDTPDQLPALAGLDEVHQALSRRARSYLHSNCSGCHRGEGPTQSAMDLRFSTIRAAMNVCDESPAFGNLGIAGARLLAPGQPQLSMLVRRPASTDPFDRMPPLATRIVHDEAISVLSDWVTTPDVCSPESDRDLDQVPDDADNCPDEANPDQSDLDRDGQGDPCDTSPGGAP